MLNISGTESGCYRMKRPKLRKRSMRLEKRLGNCSIYSKTMTISLGDSRSRIIERPSMRKGRDKNRLKGDETSQMRFNNA